AHVPVRALRAMVVEPLAMLALQADKNAPHLQRPALGLSEKSNQESVNHESHELHEWGLWFLRLRLIW
ncbi:MAG TPA: hypothetical protein VGG64_06485, partial [Pirellulales bacterium]